MSGRRVSKISPIAATSPAAPVEICQTNSILTDPDGRWVAKRQSDITAGLEERRIEQFRAKFSVDRTHPSNAPAGSAGNSTTAYQTGSKLSGESERIGQGNLQDGTPFGKHIGYL